MLALLTFVGFVSISTGCELIDYAVFVANREYQSERLTAVVWWRSNEYTVTRFLEKYKGTVVTVNINSSVSFHDTNYHDTILYRQTVFFADAPDEFEYFLKKINKIILVSIRVIMLLTNDNRYSVDNYTKIALENDVGDIIIVRNDIEGKKRLSTYKPYGNGYCSNHTAIDMSVDNMLNTTTLFIRKYNNFYNCPIRVTAHEYMPYTIFEKNNGTLTELAGIDSYLLRIIFEKLNCSMDIVRLIDYGRPNHFMDSSSENLTEFKDSNADIMIPSLVWTTKRNSVALGSHVHRQINIVWFLPIRREIYEWAKMLLPFYNKSTLFIFAAFLIVFLTIKIVIKFEKNEDESRNAIIFKMLGIFLSQSMRKYSRSWLINSLYIFWIWFCMCFQILYEGQLIEGLRKTILEPELRTFDEAVKSVNELGGPIVLKKYYRNTSIESKYKMVQLKNIAKYVEDIAHGRRFLLMGDKFQIMVYGPALAVLEQGVISLPASFHVRPRFPAALEISSLTSQILQSGLFAKITNDHTFKSFLKYKIKESNKHENSFKAMDIETLKSLLQGLIAMYVISFVVFIIEILWSKCEMRKERRILHDYIKNKPYVSG